MAKPNLDISASSLNLVRALIDFPLTGSLAEAGQETYKWLVRQSIDEAGFNACRDLAASLAYPNESGMELQKHIEAADRQILKQLKKAPLQLVVSGSLGRLIGRDPETVYIVTTVSTMTRYRDPESVASMLCSMILDRGGHEKEVAFRYDIHRAPMKAIISKIVDSVYINVVNTGKNLPDLPEELRQFHKHLLDDRTFAGIVMGVQRAEGDVTIRSQRFLADLSAWLFFHFDGTFEISVQNRIILTSELGSENRVVRLIVNKSCAEASTSCWEEDNSVEASVTTGDKFTTFLRGSADSSYRARSFARQPFYHLEDLMTGPRGTKVALLKRAEMNSVTHAAKMVMTWMLEIPLEPWNTNDGLCFALDLTGVDKTRVVGDLFVRYPQLLQLHTGEVTIPGPVFRKTEDDDNTSSSEEIEEESGRPKDKVTTAGKIVAYFPVLQDVMEAIQKRCSCRQCKSAADLDNCKPGCLRDAAMTHFLLLLGHAVSDAVGGVDASGLSNPTDQVRCMTALFDEIIQLQWIQWPTVFALGACIVSGIAYSEFGRRHLDGAESGSSQWAAVQYGSFVAAASWLDIAQDQERIKPFALDILEGTIQGVPDDCGLVRCERMTTDLSTLFAEGKSEDDAPSMAGWSLIKDLDTVDANVFTAVFREDTHLYRLMTTVQSGSYIRIVDPSTVARGVLHARRPHCGHKNLHESTGIERQSKVHDFDYALGHWNSEKPPALGNIIVMSKTLDSLVKVNTLLSLSFNGGYCILRDAEHCCVKCALKALEGSKSWDFERIVSYRRTDRRQLGVRRRAGDT
ncbi:MAG: hypothetical protein Q9157_006890 [Trypethelium eluteriae]